MRVAPSLEGDIRISRREIIKFPHRVRMQLGLHLVFGTAHVSFALDNGLARTPPMGWLSWERFGCQTDCSTFPNRCISEVLYTDMADKLVELGLAEVGYQYVNIDDCWSERVRSVDGGLREDPDRFPSGMKALSDHIHSLGLKFGMYTDIGSKTCGGYPGLSGGFLDSDIRQFVEWEIDALKVDGCYANVSDMSGLYSALGDVLNSTGRPILYSCSWPAYQTDHCENEADMETLKSKCNLWRNWDDIEDSWSSVRSIIEFWARKSSTDIMVASAGAGHWNDPDMLVVGNPGLSISEQRAQFAFWAIFAAPLYISADLRTIPPESLEILKNEEVVNINQDALGLQGFVLSSDHNRRIWVRPLSASSDGYERVAILFENKSSIFGSVRFQFTVAQLGWTTNGGTYSVRDVHSRSDKVLNAPIIEPFVVDVEESSVELFIFTRRASSGDDLAVVQSI